MLYSLRSAKLHVVTNHQAQSITLLVEKLATLGYRRIGLHLWADWDKKVNHNYFSGFIAAQESLPTKQRIRPHVAANLDKADFQAWFRRVRPDVVVTQAFTPTITDWLRPLRVPGDIGVADLSANPELPQSAGIYQNDRLIGATVAEVVIGILQRNERGLPSNRLYTLVEGIWKTGFSLRDKNND